MTRINVVPPAELSGPHLVAEYRELPRIFGLVQKAAARGERPDDRRNPPAYVLGPGHVRFFYPRLDFLARRFAALVEEMRRRGYAPSFSAIPTAAGAIPGEWWGSWEPDPAALALNRSRIAERNAK